IRRSRPIRLSPASIRSQPVLAQHDDVRTARPPRRAAADHDRGTGQRRSNPSRTSAAGTAETKALVSPFVRVSTASVASLAQDIVAEIEQRRFELNASLLKVYNYYRVFVGLALLGMFLQPFTETSLGKLHSE